MPDENVLICNAVGAYLGAGSWWVHARAIAGGHESTSAGMIAWNHICIHVCKLAYILRGNHGDGGPATD